MGSADKIDMKALERLLADVYRKHDTQLFFHNWEHTLVVRKYALELGRALDANLEILEAAALLHDAGYLNDPQSMNHEEESVVYAADLAKDPRFSGLGKMMDTITDCILATRMNGVPGSLEAMIVKDADLIQFALVNYPKKVFELNFELNTNKKVHNLPLREFIKSTPKAMKMWVPYDEKTGVTGYITDLARERAGAGFIRLYNLFMFFREIAGELGDNEFEEIYISFLMALERECEKDYHKIVEGDHLFALARACYYKEKYNRIERERDILKNAELKISEGLSMSEVIGYILPAMVEAMEAQAATLFIVESDGMIHFADTFYAESVPDPERSKEKLLKMKPMPRGQGIVGSVIESGEPRIVRDTSADKDFYKKPSEKLKFEVKTMLAVPILYFGKAVGAIQVLNREADGDIVSFNETDLRLAEGMARIAASSITRASLYDSIIKTLIDIIDAKDNYTRRHTENVTQYAVRLATALGMDENDLKRTAYAASLHDIGKIGTPESILNKPGKLTDKEFAVMKKHVILPGKVQAINFPPYLADVPFIASCHHERYDGSGYLKGLGGEDIPLIARVLAVADVFDALTSDRPYRKAMPLKKALAILKEGRGTHFDARLVDVFINLGFLKSF
jgi:putative nucleotidyltransferase with HDIG domain